MGFEPTSDLDDHCGFQDLPDSSQPSALWAVERQLARQSAPAPGRQGWHSRSRASLRAVGRVTGQCAYREDLADRVHAHAHASITVTRINGTLILI